MELVRGGLKDAGLQPGEVVLVLDYLDRRQRAPPTTQPLPPSPLSPHPSSSSSSAVQHSSISRHNSLPNTQSVGTFQSQQFSVSRQTSYPPPSNPYSRSAPPTTHQTTNFPPSNPQPQSFQSGNPQPPPGNPRLQSFGSSNHEPRSFVPSNPELQPFRPQSVAPQPLSPAVPAPLPPQGSHVHHPQLPPDNQELAGPYHHPVSIFTPTPHPSFLPTQQLPTLPPTQPSPSVTPGQSSVTSTHTKSQIYHFSDYSSWLFSA